MSDTNGFELSRRTALAALGGIGVASAGAGLGTSAYFSDGESFEHNTLTAGELDLKVDWQQTYDGPIPGTDGEVGEHPVNAYPDTAVDGQRYGDGLQDLNDVRYSGAGELAPVFDAADVPACCDCAEDEYYVTYGGESYCIEPLSSEDSVEDFYDYSNFATQNGDITRGNASVLFLYENSAEDELSLVIVNDDTQENGGGAASFTIEGAPDMSGWLAGSGDWKVQDDEPDPYNEWEAHWGWQDGYTDGGALGPLSEEFALRLSASFNGAAQENDRRGSNPQPVEEVTILSGGTGQNSDEILLETGLDEDVNNEVGPITIHSPCGIDSGAALETPAVFRSENYPEQERLVELADVKPGDSGEMTFSLHLCDNPGYVWLTAGNFSRDGGTLTEPEEAAMEEGDSDDGELADRVSVTLWYDDDCDNAYDEGTETEIFEGTLAELMDELGVAEGADEEDDDFAGMLQLDAEPGDDGGVECFPAEEGFCVGFEWAVPTDVGNEIQGDSAAFDLGFYTEQCRHNDGSGPDGDDESDDGDD
ncbi:MAG: SipW-dependent-type signal peptide-containing protein [Halanaeroarchaeum sp.]